MFSHIFALFVPTINYVTFNNYVYIMDNIEIEELCMLQLPWLLLLVYLGTSLAWT